MAQIKTLTKLVSRTQTSAITGQCVSRHFYATTSVESTEWTAAKPLTECPKVTTFDLIRGFLPGGKFYKKDLNDFIRILHSEKGDIVHVAGMLGRPANIFTQNPDDFEKVFRTEGVWPTRDLFETLTHHRHVHRKDFFGEASGLLTTQGKQWGDIRSAVNPIIMHPKNVKKYLATMSKVNEEFIERIKVIRDPKTLEVPANFKQEIHHWTLESVALVALDTQLGLISGRNDDAKHFIENIEKFFELSFQLEMKPSLWRQLPNRKLKLCMKVLDDMLMYTEKYIDEAVERLRNSSANNNTAENSEKSVLEKLYTIDKKMAIIMAMEMMFAGVDTTTTAFTSCLFALAKNPAKQQKLREEILQILPHKTTPLTEENMRNMPYLRACIKESLRVFPFTSANFRTTSKDLVLSGYRVPKGTDIYTVYMNLILNPAHYSQPEEFIPERWLRQSKDSNSSASAEVCPHSTATRSSHPFVYLPFGFGPRSCIGRRIAEMEIEIGIVNILRNFQLEFNYSTENAYVGYQINVPVIPLKFKFTDINDNSM